MKLLIHSNGPTVKTGYGVQVQLLVDRLVAAGHEVAVSATYGQPSGCGMGTYVTPSGQSVPVYPNGIFVSGDDVICAHAQQFFGTDEGWIIPLLDVWSLKEPKLAQFNVAAWAPVDHDPVPKMVVDFFARTGARCVAMSKHGQEEFKAAGIDAAYIPLAVDTNVFKPTSSLPQKSGRPLSGREFLDVPEDAFLVGMVGMNKDPNSRKGWAEAFQAFATLLKSEPRAVLYVHTEKTGVQGGLNLPALAKAAGIPDGSIRFSNQYAYLIGFAPNMMALMYSTFDVLLAPSAGEGFCVPLVEAQACGTPVIASAFTAQTELVGAGWLVDGQRWWDDASGSWYFRADVDQVADALVKAAGLKTGERLKLSEDAVRFAGQYDADYVFNKHWAPYLASLDTRPAPVKPKMERVAVFVPAMARPQNVKRLVDSFNASNDGTANLYYICDEFDTEQIAAVEAAGAKWLPAKTGTSYASKNNHAFNETTEDWVFLSGDDVEFTPGWIQAARELSDRYDIIGTNDSEPGRVRNPRVAAGKHADHFFVRRQYVMDEGSSLEGPGILLPEAYYHFFVDVEVIGLAKARGVWTPCLESVVIHHHPGYDGREDLRAKDKAYMKAVEFSEMDQMSFKRRVGLIEMHRAPHVKVDLWS